MDSQPVPRVTEMYILGSENPPSRAEIPPVHYPEAAQFHNTTDTTCTVSMHATQYKGVGVHT